MVLSFPGPDRSIKLADLQQGNAVSRRYRNRRIGEFLKELDLTEGRSTGLPKMFEKMTRNGSPKPIFETDEDRTYFLVRLPVHEKVAELEQAPLEVINQVGTKQGLSGDQVTHQVRELLVACDEELSRSQLMKNVGLSDRVNFRENYLNPALDAELIEMTQPDSPRSPTQKYRLTSLGKRVLANKEL